MSGGMPPCSVPGPMGPGPMGPGPGMPPVSMGGGGPMMHGPPSCGTPNHCGPPPNNFHANQFNGIGPCGPCVPNSPSNCGPPTSSHLRGQSPSRPGSSGPPFIPPSGSPFHPFGPPGPPMGMMGSSGPMPGPPGPHGPPGPPPQFLGPPGPPNFGPPPGMHPGMSPHGPHGPPMGPHGPMHGPPPHFMDRMDPGFRMSRRPLPIPQPDYRIHEMNKRLQQRTEDSDNLWWDAFATEFFEDDANLIITFCLEDGPKRFSIGRTLIPRYFRSIFEGGVTDLRYDLRLPKESFHNTTITLDCDQCTVVTLHGKPMFTKVCTEGRLIVEFTFDDMMRIRSWHFSVRNHRELIPRSILAMQEPGMVESLSKNITRQGLTTTTLNYLRLCVILEPMQELMSRHKAYALNPRDCLKTTLYQKWQKMVAPPVSTSPNNGMAAQCSPKAQTKGRGRASKLLESEPLETSRQPNKRRKRKGAAGGGGQGPGGGGMGAKNKRSPGPNFSLASQEVMVVGEPSLMGGEFGEEDERLISRLENSQYDPAAAAAQQASGGGPGPGGPGHHMGPPPNQGMDDFPPPGHPPMWGNSGPGPNSGPGGPPGGPMGPSTPSGGGMVKMEQMDMKKSPKN